MKKGQFWKKNRLLLDLREDLRKKERINREDTLVSCFIIVFKGLEFFSP
jgi:hypothetical protein